jgi:DNA-directed RNA polymerase specialized sigma24 family protein
MVQAACDPEVVREELDKLGIRGRPLTPDERQAFEARALALLRAAAATRARSPRRVVRRLVLEAAKKSVGAEPDAGRWLHQIRACLRRKWRSSPGLDRGELVQAVAAKLHERFLLRRTADPFPRSYIDRVSRSVIVDALRRLKRQRPDPSFRRPIALRKEPRVSPKEPPPTKEEVLRRVAAAEPDASEALDRRAVVRSVMDVLAPQSREVVRAAYLSDMDYVRAAERLRAERPDKSWDSHEVRKYLDEAFTAARRELTGLREQPSWDGVPPADTAGPLLADALFRSPAGRLFVLDHWYDRRVTERLIEAVRAASPEERGAVCDKLLADYLSDDRTPQIHRANAIYLVSRLRPGDEAFGHALQAGAPGLSEPLLYRTFQIGMGYLGMADAADDYAAQLWKGRGRRWDRQREENLRFHDFYYGGRPNAVARLREKLASASPASLLTVATLAMVSGSAEDLDALDRQREHLLRQGVELKILREAEDMIWRRISATHPRPAGGVRRGERHQRGRRTRVA